MKIPIALTIAGSDPSGGAGIQADLKTFHRFGVYGMSVITLLTIQNTRTVKDVICVERNDVKRQLETVLEDIRPTAAKTGALGNAETIEIISRFAKQFRFPLVVDPVMISKHGAPLMEKSAREVLKKKLLPCAAVVTPNIHETEILADMKIVNKSSMETAARRLLKFGPRAVLIKGGHLKNRFASDLFMESNGRVRWFESKWVKTRSTHGTGCTFSAAITAELSRGKPLAQAVSSAKKFITQALRDAFQIGHGTGPVNHGISFC